MVFRSSIKDWYNEKVDKFKNTDRTTKGLFKAATAKFLIGIKVLMERRESRKAMFLNVVTLGHADRDTRQHIDAQEELAEAKREVRYRAARLMFRAKDFKGVVKSLASIPLSLTFLMSNAGSKLAERHMSQSGVYHITTFKEKSKELSRDIRWSDNSIELLGRILFNLTIDVALVAIPLVLGGVENVVDGVGYGFKKIIEKTTGKKPKTFVELLDKGIDKIRDYENCGHGRY